MKNYLLLFALVTLTFACCKDDETPPEPVCKHCMWIINDGSNCRHYVDEYCDTELESYESGNGNYGVLPATYPNGYPQCYATETEARGCKEIYYSQYWYDTGTEPIGEERILGEYCWPYDETQIQADKDSVETLLAEEFSLDLSGQVQFFVSTSERCLP